MLLTISPVVKTVLALKLDFDELLHGLVSVVESLRAGVTSHVQIGGEIVFVSRGELPASCH